MMKTKEIKIPGCIDCPFNYEFDMGPGYGCNLDFAIRGNEALTNPQKIQEDHKTHRPITPDWCPLKKDNFLFKFEPTS